MLNKELKVEELESTIKDNDIVLIDFWAEWCGPCKMFGPIFEKASEENPDLHFAKCDTENQPELAAQFQVSSIPTLAIFREGILIYKQPGALPEAGLKDIISQVKGLDMEDVKKQIAEDQAKNS